MYQWMIVEWVLMSRIFTLLLRSSTSFKTNRSTKSMCIVPPVWVDQSPSSLSIWLCTWNIRTGLMFTCSRIMLSQSTIIGMSLTSWLLRESLMKINSSKRSRSKNFRATKTKLKKWKLTGREKRKCSFCKMKLNLSDYLELSRKKLKNSEFRESLTKSKRDFSKQRSRKRRSLDKNKWLLMRRNTSKR